MTKRYPKNWTPLPPKNPEYTLASPCNLINFLDKVSIFYLKNSLIFSKDPTPESSVSNLYSTDT